MSSNYNYDDEPTQYGTNIKSDRRQSAQQNNARDDEATQYDTSDINQRLDDPQLDEPAASHAANTPSRLKSRRKKNNSMGATVGVAAGAGILLGGAAVFLTSFTPHQDNADSQTPEWSDGKVPIAHKVNDDMSYSEAFETARQEVGPGGVFTWHGNVYGTYYQTEWDNMSEAERAEFNNHFDWDKLDTADNHHHDSGSSSHNDDADVVAHEDHSSHASHNSASHHSSASHSEAHAAAAPAHHDDSEADVVNVDNVEHGHSDGAEHVDNDVDSGDVEVLGVTQDPDSGMTIGQIRVDGEDAVLVDVDSDQTFDVLAQDANHDGQLQDNEMVDIHDAHITTQDLGGVQPTTASTDDVNVNVDDGGIAGTDNEPDYIDDGVNS